MRKLPDGFKLGVATAAYQIEGGWNAADKAPSMWDNFCHKPSKIADNTTGDDACKSYEYYKRDIEMLKFLSVDFYRFSISWPRILPTSFPNKISEAGLTYYNNIINELLVNNIEPVITLYHWDLPQNLQDLGGWANPLIVDWFEDYARTMYQLFGDRVKTWITINEPKQIAIYGYGLPRLAPGINSHGIGDYLAVKHVVMAHARAWHVYDKEFRAKQKGICGITIALDYREGMTDSPSDMQAGKDAMDFEVGLYSHPIFSTKGGFPDSVVRIVGEKSAAQGFFRSRLPEFTPEEIEYVKGTSDFFGFNHYSSRFYSREKFEKGMYPVPSYDDDIGAYYSYMDYEKSAVIHVTVVPQGIRKALNWVKDTCNNPPIMITENGFATYGGLDDEKRIMYYNKYLNATLDAIDIDNCNVISYTAWSLMDNFEWGFGLRIKFGLFEVDYEDDFRTRKPRNSAFWYKKLIATRAIEQDYKTEFKEISF
ncbi:myrosinase 1-like isoform X2 [Epargyreus clarus]